MRGFLAAAANDGGDYRPAGNFWAAGVRYRAVFALYGF
jgi:hypothetical protein